MTRKATKKQLQEQEKAAQAASDALWNDRVDMIAEMMLRGSDERAVHRFARKSWQDKDPTTTEHVEQMITEAQITFRGALDIPTDDLLRDHVAKRRKLYAASVRINDFKTAAGLLTDEARLLGLYDTSAAERPPARPRPSWHQDTSQT